MSFFFSRGHHHRAPRIDFFIRICETGDFLKFKGKLRKTVKTAASIALLLTALFCLGRRLPEALGSGETALTAAAFTLTDGKYYIESGTSPSAEETVAETTLAEKPSAVSAEAVTRQRDKSGYYDTNADHSGEEMHSVAEKTIGADGEGVRGCFVKNNTGLDVDFEQLLDEPLTFRTERDSGSPQVLIYHTHTGEAYLDEDADHFYDSYYSRTNNNDFNVVAVGEALKRALEKKGINTLHDLTVHDSTYNGSYERSAETVREDMEKYPSVKVVLDIHRDALGSEDCKVKTVFEHDGKKGAQIMILAGCDPDNERGFSNWKNNLSFALKLQSTAENLYPGMTRPLDFGIFAYNEYLCDGSLLIEIGTDANSIDEAEYSAELLAEVLSRVLK